MCYWLYIMIFKFYIYIVIACWWSCFKYYQKFSFVFFSFLSIFFCSALYSPTFSPAFFSQRSLELPPDPKSNMNYCHHFVSLSLLPFHFFKSSLPKLWGKLEQNFAQMIFLRLSSWSSQKHGHHGQFLVLIGWSFKSISPAKPNWAGMISSTTKFFITSWSSKKLGCHWQFLVLCTRNFKGIWFINIIFENTLTFCNIV